MKINVLGYGVMARQIAALFYCIGYKVVIWSHNEVDESLIKKNIRMVKRFVDDSRDGWIYFVKSIDRLENHITIESVLEDLSIKVDLYESLKDKIDNYFTNSSSILPGEIGENVHAFHFYNPISIKLIEVSCCENVVELDDILSRLRMNGYNVICEKGNYGYVGNLIIFKEVSSAFELIEVHGYSLEDISVVYGNALERTNIFKIVDLIGVDVAYSILKKFNANLPGFYMPKLMGYALSKNILGRKNKTSIMSILK